MPGRSQQGMRRAKCCKRWWEWLSFVRGGPNERSNMFSDQERETPQENPGDTPQTSNDIGVDSEDITSEGAVSATRNQAEVSHESTSGEECCAGQPGEKPISEP